jgi:hypothetical protein
VNTAAADPVKDYRELAAHDGWADIIGARRELRYLDVCCGTGRWLQAFSENVLRPRNILVDADLVDLCSSSLVHLEDRIPELPEIQHAKDDEQRSTRSASTRMFRGRKTFSEKACNQRPVPQQTSR